VPKFKINIVDTQGLNDSKGGDSEFCKLISEKSKENNIKVACFLFVTKQQTMMSGWKKNYSKIRFMFR